MHALFSVAEVVRTVVEFCGEEDNNAASALTVCKEWSEMLLDILWYEVTSFKRLTSPIGPLVEKPDGSYVGSSLRWLLSVGYSPLAT